MPRPEVAPFFTGRHKKRWELRVAFPPCDNTIYTVNRAGTPSGATTTKPAAYEALLS